MVFNLWCKQLVLITVCREPNAYFSEGETWYTHGGMACRRRMLIETCVIISRGDIFPSGVTAGSDQFRGKPKPQAEITKRAIWHYVRAGMGDNEG